MPSHWPFVAAVADGRLAESLLNQVYDEGEPDAPEPLKRLLTVDTDNEEESLRQVKATMTGGIQLNRSLALASLTYQSPGTLSHDLRRLNDGRGPPAIKIAGQVYASLGCILPNEEHPARFAQLYTCDPVRSEHVCRQTLAA